MPSRNTYLERKRVLVIQKEILEPLVKCPKIQRTCGMAPLNVRTMNRPSNERSVHRPDIERPYATRGVRPLRHNLQAWLFIFGIIMAGSAHGQDDSLAVIS